MYASIAGAPMGLAADNLRPTEELRQRSLPAKEQRNLLPSQTHALPVVRNHRRWLSRDIDRLLTKSWDPSLADDELLAVNDELNKLVKRKAAWDTRLVELGGVLEDAGAVAVAAGYHYYGRAKHMLAPEANPQGDPTSGTGKRQGHLYQLVNAEYYGFDHQLFPPAAAAPAPPSQGTIEAAILRAKKAALLAKLDSIK